jgi:hypothetical protein
MTKASYRLRGVYCEIRDNLQFEKDTELLDI